MQVNQHVGRVSVLPKLTHVGQNNLSKVTFGLAIDSEISKDKTNFLYYEAIGKTADLINQFVKTKGTILEVSFEIQSRQFTNSNGEQRNVYANVVTQFKVWAAPKAKEKAVVDDPTSNENFAPIQQDFAIPDDFIDYEH
jgi:Single-stranded DNA-binding protein